MNRVARGLSIAARVIASLFSQGVALVVSVFARGYNFVESWLLDRKKATIGIAVTRIIFGITAMGLLLANWSTRLYAFGPGSAWNGEAAHAKSDFPKIWVFSAFHDAMLNGAFYTFLYIALFVLAILFTIGWRFRIVHPVFFCLWVGFIEANDMLGDQGDNMFRIVLMILFFADPAGRLSIDAIRRRSVGSRGPWVVRIWRGQRLFSSEVGNLFHNLALVALTAQVCFVYVSGALFKAGGSPWAAAYAIYNPLQTDRFGTWPMLSDLVTHWAPVVAVLTWGSILVQLSFPFMLLTRPTRIVALIGILSFHIGIGVLMGLPWFSLAMIGVDAIFIRDQTYRSIGDAVMRSIRQASEAHPRDAVEPVESGAAAND